MAKGRKKRKPAVRRRNVVSKPAERGDLISREVLRHPDGTEEVVETFETPGDWQEAAARLAELHPKTFGSAGETADR